jgi:16S rRNA processing protein RimM
MDADALLIIGEIVGVHGIRGNVKILPHAETEPLFDPARPLVIAHRDGRREQRVLRWVKPHKRLLLASIEGVESRADAELLVGARAVVRRADLPEPEPGSYYWNDLLGLAVYTRESAYLGVLENIIATGSNDVYVVRRGQRETLVPALATVVVEVDLEAGTMHVDLPEGL